MSHRAFIAIGSNLGNPAEQCHRALCRLENAEGIELVHCSSFYPTDPLVPKGVNRSTIPSYVNAVCEVETTLSPERLLDCLLAVEREMGRTRRKKWESRLIDLDLLFYDDLVFHTNTLRVPHPEIQNRRFVLEPLCEIAPKWVHPVLKQSIEELSASMSLRATNGSVAISQDRSGDCFVVPPSAGLLAMTPKI